MSNELRKNAEGYADPTAAATLSQQEPGDIWGYNETECLVIKNHGAFSSILLLVDTRGGDHYVKIQTEYGPKYTDPRRLTYGNHAKMGRFIDTVSSADFKRVTEAVSGEVGLLAGPRVEADAENVQDLLEQLAAAREHMETLESELCFKKAEVAAANNTAEKARNQLELLREMYNDLLYKVLDGQN